MAMNTITISELRKLLTVVTEHGNKHLVDVEADLKQAAFLLNEAIDKLGTSFLHLDQKIVEQKQMMDASPSNANSESLASIQAEISAQIQQVVTNLQFQDMTNQIIDRSLKRVTGLKNVLDELGSHGDHASADTLEHEKEEIEAYVQSLEKSLNHGSDAITGGINNQSVGQKDMSSGSIELF